jgi:outer membrane protein OmpA-like peptidoglycan-associated protein
MTNGMMKIGARLAVLAMVGFGASACSSIPDWVDPTNWGGGPSDTEQAAGETPDLATLPDRPTGTTSATDQQEVSQSLDADRTRAKYSADALRGGTEAEAAPPPPASAPSQVAAAQPPAPPPPAPAPAPAVSPDADTVTVPQGNAAPTAAAPPSSAPEAAPLPPAPAPAMEAPPPAAQSTMPPPTAPMASPPPARTQVASVDPSDAALGFRPSTAPPLDPSVGQFVPAPIISRYQQTSSSRVASVASARSAAVASMGASSAPPSVYASATGTQPSSVVYFPGDGTLLNAEGRAQVRATAKAFKQAGGQGYIRVVGHASSRTSNMPVEKHLEVIFDKSQDRANAVAKEMIRDGVPANRVLVEAVGDSQPVYYESMPKGEDGNRRAEIFLQS